MLNTIKDKITQLISGKTVPIPIKCSTCGNETTDVDLKETSWFVRSVEST